MKKVAEERTGKAMDSLSLECYITNRRKWMDPQEAISKLVQQIVMLVRPLRVILFGSAARGDMRPDSDIDVLIVVPEGTPNRKTARYLYTQINGVGMPFDLIVTTANFLEKNKDNIGLIYRQILKEGREVYVA